MLTEATGAAAGVPTATAALAAQAQPGRQFYHRSWTWADGRPRRCVVQAMDSRDVIFRLLPTKQRKTVSRDAFWTQFGSWVDEPDSGVVPGRARVAR